MTEEKVTLPCANCEYDIDFSSNNYLHENLGKGVRCPHCGAKLTIGCDMDGNGSAFWYDLEIAQEPRIVNRTPFISDDWKKPQNLTYNPETDEVR